MKIIRLTALPDTCEGNFLKGIIPGNHITAGGLTFAIPGVRSHTNDGINGRDYHIHNDAEAFVILAGKAHMEIDGVSHPLVVGDICIVESGEDHHIISDKTDPSVHIWLHVGTSRNKEQQC